VEKNLCGEKMTNVRSAFCLQLVNVNPDVCCLSTFFFGDHLCLKNQFFASFMMQTFEISAFAEMFFFQIF